MNQKRMKIHGRTAVTDSEWKEARDAGNAWESKPFGKSMIIEGKHQSVQVAPIAHVFEEAQD